MDAQSYRFTWQGVEIEAVYEPLRWGVIAHLSIRSIKPERAPLPITGTGYRSHFHPAPSNRVAAMWRRKSSLGSTRKPPSRNGSVMSMPAGRANYSERYALSPGARAQRSYAGPGFNAPEVVMCTPILDKLAEASVFYVEIENGGATITDACDWYYSKFLTASELSHLGDEFLALAEQARQCPALPPEPPQESLSPQIALPVDVDTNQAEGRSFGSNSQARRSDMAYIHCGTVSVWEWVEDSSFWVIIFWLFVFACAVKSCSG